MKLRDRMISITITQDEYNALKAAADKDERPVSTYTRRLILAALDPNNAPSESLSQSNSRNDLGVVRLVANDLSGS